MRNKMMIICISLMGLNAFSSELNFDSVPETFMRYENSEMTVSFKTKAAVYRYKDNENCDKLISKALEKEIEVNVTVNAKKNLILKCD